MKQGFAEIIKHAVIQDAEMFGMLQGFDARNLPSLVCRNIEIKASIVAADERETKGVRASLNFGHTIGHAIERAGEYGGVRHGEAISLGMVAACEISVRKAGLAFSERNRIVTTLDDFGLPTRLPADFPRDRILEAIRLDKKFRRQEVRFVVTSAIGSAHVATNVTMEDIEAAIDQL
jgi:3-dehydroquinate synthase